MLNPQGIYKGKHVEHPMETSQGGSVLPEPFTSSNHHRVAGNPLSAGQAQHANNFGLQMTTQDTLNNSSFFPQDPSGNLSYGN